MVASAHDERIRFGIISVVPDVVNDGSHAVQTFLLIVVNDELEYSLNSSPFSLVSFVYHTYMSVYRPLIPKVSILLSPHQWEMKVLTVPHRLDHSIQKSGQGHGESGRLGYISVELHEGEPVEESITLNPPQSIYPA